MIYVFQSSASLSGYYVGAEVIGENGKDLVGHLMERLLLDGVKFKHEDVVQLSNS